MRSTMIFLSAAIVASWTPAQEPPFPKLVAWPVPDAGRISPALRMHAEGRAGRLLSADGQVIPPRVLGLTEGAADREECAIYLRRKPGEAERLDWEALGVSINPEVWVDAVPGRHPFGFHLAVVEYRSLDMLAADPEVVWVESLAREARPQNDVALASIRADLVHAGTGVAARTGAGVRIAIADSGLDLTHPDVPGGAALVETFDMTTGTVAPPAPAGQTAWNVNVANTVTDHGTHVTGTAVGRGTASGGAYKGSAPGAALCFYKIGNNTTGGATVTDQVEAITRARTRGCRIFSMSYGGLDPYLDGSQAMCQATDLATVLGMVCFYSAGNEAEDAIHASAVVAPGAITGNLGFALTNGGAAAAVMSARIQLTWRDNNPADANAVLTCVNLAAGESLTPLAATTASPRGTQSRDYVLLSAPLAAGASKTFNLRIQNTAAGGAVPRVHLYRIAGSGVFTAPDESFTCGNPALADSAIAVGAYKHRTAWTDYQGNARNYAAFAADSTGNALGVRAGFSSRGPRIDDVRKPEIAAPGAAMISLRDLGLGAAFYAPQAGLVIDDDGLGLGAANALANARYVAMWGTSMACPMAAGAAALLIEAQPALTPWDVRVLLRSTAANAAAPDNDLGYGLIDVRAAIQAIPPGGHTPFTFVGTTSGGGIGDGYVRLENVPAGAIQGFTLFSFDASQPAGAGWLFGLVPDDLTWNIASVPLAPGGFFRWSWPAAAPTHFPAAALAFPAGTFSALAGASIDGVGIALGPNPGQVWATSVVRDTF